MAKVNLPPPPAPEGKQFSLKPTETALLSEINKSFAQIWANIFSFIAIERLGHPVDQNTQFTLSGDLKTMTINQKEPEDAAR